MPLGAEPADHLGQSMICRCRIRSRVRASSRTQTRTSFFAFVAGKSASALTGERHRGNDKKLKNREQKGDSDRSSARG